MCREIWAIYDRHSSVHRLSLYHLRVHGPLAKGAATCILYGCDVAGDWPRSCDGRLQPSPVVLRENPSDKNLAIFVTSLFKGGKGAPGFLQKAITHVRRTKCAVCLVFRGIGRCELSESYDIYPYFEIRRSIYENRRHGAQAPRAAVNFAPGIRREGETGAEQTYWCECDAECLWVRTSSASDRRILYRHARRWSHRCCQWRRPERPCSYLWVQKRHWGRMCVYCPVHSPRVRHPL